MIDTTTEEKIKQAALKIFIQKGYAATRTRDIAQEAGVNPALINYYYRSKENLFDVVLSQEMKQLVEYVEPILSDISTTLEEKIKKLAINYTDILLKNPNLPLFIFNEIKVNVDTMSKLMDINRVIDNRATQKQLDEKGIDMTPEDLIINILGLIVFPFVASPLLRLTGVIKEDGFAQFIERRKKLIPIWIEQTLSIRK